MLHLHDEMVHWPRLRKPIGRRRERMCLQTQSNVPTALLCLCLRLCFWAVLSRFVHASGTHVTYVFLDELTMILMMILMIMLMMMLQVPMRAARRSSYDFVVDHCLLEKEAVLANTRKNAETKVEGAIPKVVRTNTVK